ncbi:uncharacterized protein M421DRAFT_96610 [Didymella exigua CBS 183.55]|uniref:AB hydrolase-1 domain-containing protein n=1 Tax=Didymella exigua CBS 183.55 TaxID=1150837 RepID=A0A6A5R5U4_9PLEO|nr:uncharacterized protein M421DRAFT_96610 [Didymella exigua CBS 183.55]KAF1922759.1 hypothetical protein M421DRAFT_96610 [Didymella exigua CBS 183.55]
MTSLSNLADQDEANSNSNNRRAPPPLPPRASQPNEMNSPPSYTSVMAMSSHDPRSSSTQSLIPDPSLENTGRRRILLVYVHGFMGNETSFRSFPAHVHNLVAVTLADTHVVHTKIYPRYRARYSLEQARDQFSAWLAPHEDQWTDVILLGHSMGGLLAADVTLLFRHRIIGIINFDVPFVGMHPGIIKAGLGSIFTKAPPPEDKILTSPATGSKPSRMSTIFNPKPADPNYNPSFANDVHLPVRKGLDNALHWFNKHSNNIKEAGKGLVKSHFEFGSAMADYKELKDRYARVRALEEEEETKRRMGNPDVRSPPRIRFVNYYTASTGRPKKPKSPKSPSPSRPGSLSLQHQDSDASGLVTQPQQDLNRLNSEPGTPSPLSIDVKEHRGSDVVSATLPEILSGTSPSKKLPDQDSGRLILPEIPPIPQEPHFVDTAQIADKTQRRVAEREYDEALEAYQKAVKARNKIINEREDMEEAWEVQRQQHITVPLPPQSKAELTGEELRLAQEKGRMAREQARLEGREYHSPAEDITASVEETPSTATPGLESGLHTMQLGDATSHSPYSNYSFSRSAILSQTSPDDQASVTDSNYTSNTTEAADSSDTKSDKKKKEKKLGKFCMLPPKDGDGHKDPTWIRVYMEDMDEVAAHTSLFFMNETYERLVGDVGDRIEEWVREADSVRVVREMSGMA